MLKAVTKRDLYFVILILAMISAYLLFRGNMQSAEVVNIISIGAGITSIFLAMVSIQYAFSQTQNSTRQGEITMMSLDGITKEVHALSLLRDEFTSVKDEFVALRETSEEEFGKIHSAIVDLPETVGKRFFSILDSKNIDVPQGVKEQVEQEIQDEFASTFRKLIPETRVERWMHRIVRLFEDDVRKNQIMSYAEIVRKLNLTSNESRRYLTVALKELTYQGYLLEARNTNGMLRYQKNEVLKMGDE